MKLNIGCGSKIKKGYINIDIISTIADIRANASALPFKDNSIEVIESYHLIEHMSKSLAETSLHHWYSLLKTGGQLVIECPDITEVIKEYLKGNEDMLYSMYGRDRYPYDTHCWGYSKSNLSELLKSIGFNYITTMNGTDYHAQFEPCLRIEAIK